MKVVSLTEQKVTNVRYRLEGVPDFGVVIFTDSYNENGKIVDTFMTTEQGYIIKIPALMDQIVDAVSSYSPAE